MEEIASPPVLTATGTGKPNAGMVDGAASGDWGIRRREPLEDNRVVLSEQEQHTYLHLGIIAANAGYGGAIYRWRQGLSGIGSGDYFVETGDLAG